MRQEILELHICMFFKIMNTRLVRRNRNLHFVKIARTWLESKVVSGTRGSDSIPFAVS
jgi:hypothetical protein